MSITPAQLETNWNATFPPLTDLEARWPCTGCRRDLWGLTTKIKALPNRIAAQCPFCGTWNHH